MSAKCWSIYWLILNWHIDRVCWHVDWHRSPHDRHACLTILGWHLADTSLTLFSQHYCHLAAPFTELHLLYSNINLNSLTLRNFFSSHFIFISTQKGNVEPRNDPVCILQNLLGPLPKLNVSVIWLSWLMLFWDWISLCGLRYSVKTRCKLI